jgi:S1-C subfamily serine protease
MSARWGKFYSRHPKNMPSPFSPLRANARRIGTLVLSAATLIWCGFTVPLSAESQEVLQADNHQLLVWTEGCLVDVSNTDDPAVQKKKLNWAFNHLKQVEGRFGTNSDLEQAIADVKNIRDDVNNKEDSSKINEDVNIALQVVRPLMNDAAMISATAASLASPNPVEHPVTTVKLPEDQARAVVLIKGDNAEGTGFLVNTHDGPVVVTNIHVISNNPNLKITTNTGGQLVILSYKGADDRDLAMIAITPGDYKYLDLAPDISSVQPGDEVITPGNSRGGDVMLNTDGKVLGLGPDRVEFDNPIYHGNSGGPVIHVKSGKVIGVVTEAIKVDVTDELDKASFANRNSAIGSSMRYFGMRLDTVSNWLAIDMHRLATESAFLDQFDKLNRCLDCYLNAPDDNKIEDQLWKEAPKIVQANSEYFDQANGSDTSQQMQAYRVMWSEIDDVAKTNMEAAQTPSNFYPFDRQRAADEAAYRKAIQAELNEIDNNVSRLGSLPRTNH